MLNSDLETTKKSVGTSKGKSSFNVWEGFHADKQQLAP